MFFMLIKLYMETCKGMNIRAYVLRNGHAKAERVMCGIPFLNGFVATRHALVQ